ncbi:MAG: hypothetical protein KKC72_08395 [Alphaproteobacteria bacterium]|nr:hypothetical protein [Alphaproteobacteria bacterium]
MDDKIQRAMDRIAAAQAMKGKAMWYMVLTDTILTLLADKDTISRDEIRAAIAEHRIGTVGVDSFTDACDEAIIQIDKKWPPEGT